MTIIEWYEAACKDHSFNDIQGLIQRRGQLSASSVDLAKKIKDRHSELRRKMFLAETNKKRRIIELQTTIDGNTGKPYTSAKATAIADVESAEEMLPLEVVEVEIDGDKMILKQINQVLEAMRQDIADMRAAREGK